jgi:lipopolysaccharide export system protein LptA
MRLSVERLRWGLLAGALLLIAVLVGLVSYGRYRAVQTWRNLVARSGATITHETNGVTWSQAVKGRTVFTLHAAKAVPQGNGKYSLHDAMLVLYDKTGAPADRIYGSEFEYDQKAEVAKALGEVQMDLQPPAGVPAGERGNDQTARENERVDAFKGDGIATPQTIHVRTSGLVYVRKLGVASTDQEVEIAYQGLHGYAKGAEFDTGQSVVHLLADVRAEGNVRGQPAVLTAAKADLDRSEDVIRLMQPVVRTGSRTGTRVGSAATATLYLRKDGSLERVHAERDVALRSGTRRVAAATMEAAMNAQSLVEHAELSGGVTMEDSSAARPMRGSAKAVLIACDDAGSPKRVVAVGAVSMSSEERAANGWMLHRQMGADRMTLTLAHAKSGAARRGRSTQVSAIEAAGSASVRGESLVTGSGKAAKHAGVKTTEVAADDLRLTLAADAAGKNEPESLAGTGHTRLGQKTLDGGDESSTGDSLQIRFGAEASGSASGLGAGLRVASAEQSGHIVLRSQPGAKAGAKSVAEVSTGSAEGAEFDGARNEVTLTGRPRLVRGDTDVSAETIVLEEGSGDAAAHGAVSASFVKDGEAESPATHVVASDAFLHRAAETIEFRGTDAQPVRMWQGASQLEAARVVLDKVHDTLVARPAEPGGLVHAVFASLGLHAAGSTSVGAGGAAHDGQRTHLHAMKGSTRVVRVASARVDYTGASREAVFSGGVRSEGATGMVQAERGVVFLNPSETKTGASVGKHGNAEPKTQGQPDLMGGSVDKIVLSGGVRMEEPGRQGTGDQLLYTASSGEFVLTGSPGRLPHVVDEKQGSVTGATLLFGSADSTIIVAGEPASHGHTPGRVHTETQVKP